MNFDRFADMSFGNLQNNYFFLEKKMVKTWGAETEIKRYDLFFVSSVFRGKISFFCFSFFFGDNLSMRKLGVFLFYFFISISVAKTFSLCV